MRARKKVDDFVKLHLTQSPEKLNPYQVINNFLHAFAKVTRSEKGVISHGSKEKSGS
jgi:hypothetical protein